MSNREQVAQMSDYCPRCMITFQITSVQFSLLKGAKTFSACSKCGFLPVSSSEATASLKIGSASKLKNSVLVVVPVLNEEREIRNVIQGLLDERIRGGRSTIVIVDGGSTDGTATIVRKIAIEEDRVKTLENSKRIQSAGVNLAVATYGKDHDVIVRCDAHALYPPDFLNNLLATLVRTGADSVVIPMDSVGETCVQRAVAWVSDSAVGSGGAAHRGGKKSGFVDHGHHAAFRTEAFRRIGGYDETYAFNEDAELDSRLRRYGGSIYLDSEIRLKYKPRNSLAKLMRQYFFYGLGRSRTMRRHPESVRLRQVMVPLNFLFLLGAFAIEPFSKVTLAWPIAYFFMLILVSLRTALLRRSMCGLLAGLAAFIMHNAWATGFIFGMCTIREERWIKPGMVSTQ